MSSLSLNQYLSLSNDIDDVINGAEVIRMRVTNSPKGHVSLSQIGCQTLTNSPTKPLPFLLTRQAKGHLPVCSKEADKRKSWTKDLHSMQLPAKLRFDIMIILEVL
jgi:hypothetical protein